MNFDDIIIKYPRTPHIEGSRLQPGDEDLSQRQFDEIAGKYLVLEEKIDGANSAISFSPDGELRIQSRGHFLTGGARERHYDLLKQWAAVHRDKFYEVLGRRYVMYGEWMYAKHSIYYDLLPNYFIEFDIYDRENGLFLSTSERRKLIAHLPVSSCAVLAEGIFHNRSDVLQYLTNSKYISERHLENLRETAQRLGVDADAISKQTDATRTMEGIYIKVESDGSVTDRMKFVRPTFLQTVVTTDQKWLNRVIIPNKLAITLSELFIP